MQFSSWYYLLLLLLIPVLHRWWMRRNRPPRVKFSLPVPAQLRKRNPVRLFLLLRYVGIALLLFALSRPQTSYKQVQRNVQGIDIIMVMDVSASMNIEDLADRSRFEVAKDTMKKFIKGRTSDRIGFIVFSGEPLTLAPPTLDYGLVFKTIRDAKIGVLRDGTAIGDGLSLAVSRLRNSQASSRVIILLTDGDNNVGQIDPATAGELAAGYGIRVYTIAVGREGRVKLPIRHKGPFGKMVTTYQIFDNALNPELLKHIAQLTSGKFFRVEDEATLSRVFGEIDQLERVDIESSEKIRFTDQFEKPLKFGAILLILERLLSLLIWRMVP